MDYQKKEKIKAWAAIGTVILILMIVFIIMVRYQVEGETNMPFSLSKITIISTAEGVQNKEQQAKWDFNICQNNDVYFSFTKNKNVKEVDAIQSISIENITITKTPEKGNIQVYMPNSTEGRIFSYHDKYIVQEKLTYKGAAKSDTKTLEIANQGGNMVIRFANTNIGAYASDNEEEMKHDGTLLGKIGIIQDQVAFTANFDIILTTQDKKYKANITLNMPCGEMIEQGTATLEKTDTKDVVFKRI